VEGIGVFVKNESRYDDTPDDDDDFVRVGCDTEKNEGSSRKKFL
jgi:hypothetical protein